jgi:protein-S-isoprenylcysteine O-methyltransferase Ste14
MFYFLIPLLIGFSSNLASAFTFNYSEKWGRQTGTFVTILLRDIFGIPVWAAGFLLAIRGSEDLLYNETIFNRIAGWGIILAGGMIILFALATIRKKAAAPATGDKLVQTGFYSIIRHPIHSGTFLEFAGLFILWPSLTVGIATLIGTIWIYFQSKFEEMDLEKRIPGYADYKKSTPAFFPLRLSRKEISIR